MKRIAASASLALLILAATSGCQPTDAVALSGEGLVLRVSPHIRYEPDTGKATVDLLILNFGQEPVFVNELMEVDYHGHAREPDGDVFGGGSGPPRIMGPWTYCLLRPIPPAAQTMNIFPSGLVLMKPVLLDAPPEITNDTHTRILTVTTDTIRVAQDTETGKWQVSRQTVHLEADIPSADGS